MDRQARDAQQRPVDVQEHLGAVAHDEPPGDAEVPVEPGLVRHAAVDLDGELLPARGAVSGRGLTLNVGVSVCAPKMRNPSKSRPATRQAMIEPSRIV